MEQFDREDTSPMATTSVAEVDTPIQMPTPASAPVPKKSKKLAITLSILLAIIFLGLIGYATYATLTINSLNDTVEHKDKEYSKLQADNKKLVEDNTKATKEAKDAAKAAEDNSMTMLDMIDGSFVALTPADKLVSSDGKTTFEWTTHKEATKYVVEIKSVGDATYPSAYVTDQTLTVNPSSPATSKSSLTKTLPAGNYVWRVTALHTMGDQDMVLQSTVDRNYQVK